MYILGISAYYHDSAASLIKDGQIIAAVQEERFSRIKHDYSFPNKSINYCLNAASIKAEDLSFIVFYEKPFLKFERLLETYLAFAPKGFKSFALSMPIWIKDKLFLKRKIINELCLNFRLSKKNISNKLLFSEHHLSHAASAFYPSPFQDAAILTIDGVGEWATTSVYIGKNNELKLLKEINFPHSLGLLYSAFTFYTGFKVNSGEYKIMGLAPYGKPIYANLIKKNLIKISNDGSFRLDMKYFDFATGLTMTSKKFNNLFGGPPRKPESNITQKEMDLAASIQSVTEEIILKLVQNVKKETNQVNLCLAGGVALNCVANGLIYKAKIFDKIWIQPAAGDAGGSLGAALAAWHLHNNNNKKIYSKRDLMNASYLGPSYSDDEIEASLSKQGAIYNKLNQEEIIERLTNELINQKIIGLMQGRMEFGPRALGNRSIIADPRSPSMQKILNLKVKKRESFRPFAPSILLEDVSEWFEIEEESPYMLLVAKVKNNKRIKNSKKDLKLFGIDKLNIPRSEVPAITHLDYTARIQTVSKDDNPFFHKLLFKFKEKTNCPILINTSFNIRGEPIICSPKDAFNCFMGTDIDILIIGNFILEKKKQKFDKIDHLNNKYVLD